MAYEETKLEELLPTLILITTYIIIFILWIRLKFKRHTIIGLILFTTMTLMIPKAIPLPPDFGYFKTYGASLIFSSAFSLFVFSHLLDMYDREIRDNVEGQPKPN